MTEQHECEFWYDTGDAFMWWRCKHCKRVAKVEEITSALNEYEPLKRATERLSAALVMSDEEMNAYEWCIEQGPQAVAGDYACRLAQYIRDVKLAYRKDSAEERNCDTCAITGLLCPIRNNDPPFTFPCPHWKSLDVGTIR